MITEDKQIIFLIDWYLHHNKNESVRGLKDLYILVEKQNALLSISGQKG
jgi:hypothetical protein